MRRGEHIHYTWNGEYKWKVEEAPNPKYAQVQHPKLKEIREAFTKKKSDKGRNGAAHLSLS